VAARDRGVGGVDDERAVLGDVLLEDDDAAGAECGRAALQERDRVVCGERRGGNGSSGG
jgi:hypothetical protein